MDDQRLPYMIIGGQAVLIHGRPRLTQDVDVTLGVDTDEFERVLTGCRRLKLKPIPGDPELFANEKKVLPAQDPGTKMRVDFVFSNTPYEQQAIQRAVKVSVGGYPVRFASAEDLIVHKLFAGRAIDLEDAKEVLLRQGKKLDGVYIRRCLRSLNDVSEGDKDLLSLWNRLRKEVKA